jgi:hypothetical protein
MKEVTAQVAKTAVVTELGEKLESKTWRKIRDEVLAEVAWKLEGRRLVRR